MPVVEPGMKMVFPEMFMPRVLPAGTAAVEYLAAMTASACRTSAAVRSRSLRAPMTARIGCRTFWFLVTVLAERPSSPWAGQSCAACRTV